MMKARVLVVAAHPDDEVLGCGGTMARLAAEGHSISVLILGEGLTSRKAQRNETDPSLLATHHERARKAGLLVGAQEVKILGLPDQRFDELPLLEITHALEAELSRIQPTWVLSQHGGDLNMDHSMTYRAVLTATRPTPGHSVRRVLAYEVASSSEWSFQRFSPVFRPQLFVNIADYLERKLHAMSIYESETPAFPHPRSIESLRAQALRWGSVAGVPAAEAFEVVRDIV